MLLLVQEGLEVVGEKTQEKLSHMKHSAHTAPLFFSACAGLFIYGIILALLGTVFGLPELPRRLHLGFAEEGHIFLLLYAGVFLASLIVGPIIDAAGHKAVLMTSALVVALALVAFSAAHSFAAAISAILLLGFGGGGLCTATNVLVSDLFSEERGAMLNLLGLFFSVGALLVPLLAMAMEGRFSIFHLLHLAAGLTLACGLWYAVLPFPPVRASSRLCFGETLQVIRYPGLLWIGVLLFLEAGNEAAIGGWTSVYAGNAGLSARAATFVLASYWTGMIVSRSLMALILRLLGQARTILVSALAATLGCLLLRSVSSFAMLVVGAAVVGLSFGPIFQTALGIAGDRYSRYSGSVFGVLFAIALPGAMVTPWAIGQISQRYDVRHGLFVPLIGALGICFIAAVLTAKEKAGEADAESATKE